MTDRWVNTNGSKEMEMPIVLDYQECLDDFLKTQQDENNANNYFVDHQMMDVYYETLSTDYRAGMKQVQDFLDVSYEELVPKTHKQSALPLSTAIANYHELKEKFAGTEWEEFFEE